MAEPSGDINAMTRDPPHLKTEGEQLCPLQPSLPKTPVAVWAWAGKFSTVSSPSLTVRLLSQ